MRVSDVKLVAKGNSCELHAQVTGGKLREPFLLWYRFPSHIGRFVEANYGNALLVALLLPAMKAGATLEVPAPVSAKLSGSMAKLQAIYHGWDRTLEEVIIRAPVRLNSPARGSEGALFFSCGVDSVFSLIKNSTDHPLRENDVSILVSVHGTDITVGNWKRDVFERMSLNSKLIGVPFGKQSLSIGTNIKDLMTATGVLWEMAQGPALASVGLLLEGLCSTVVFSSNSTLSDLNLSGTHPLIDPLWSTESISFHNDGWEASRLEKTKYISRYQIALEVLRVCWASERPEYNCGRCSKCLTTMLGLHIAGSLTRCKTLPTVIEVDALREIPILHPYEEPQFFDELLEELRSDADRGIRAALLEGLQRSRTYFDRLAQAKRSIAELIPMVEPFILVDEDSVREELVGRRVVPFLEKDGQYNGRPADDEAAIRELERLRGAGLNFLVFWWAELWWLDYYHDLSQHLRTRYKAVLEDENLAVFDLREQVHGL